MRVRFVPRMEARPRAVPLTHGQRAVRDENVRGDMMHDLGRMKAVEQSSKQIIGAPDALNLAPVAVAHIR